jgi:tRNA 2-thiouridine synthesizing protein A
LDVTETLDTSGLSCPLPVLKTKKAIKGLAVGDLLKVISTDPGSKKDIPSWARVTGQEIVESSEEGDKYVFVVKKLK